MINNSYVSLFDPLLTWFLFLLLVFVVVCLLTYLDDKIKLQYEQIEHDYKIKKLEYDEKRKLILLQARLLKKKPKVKRFKVFM